MLHYARFCACTRACPMINMHMMWLCFCKIRIRTFSIDLKFGRYLDSNTAEMSVKIWSEAITMISNLAALKLFETSFDGETSCHQVNRGPTVESDVRMDGQEDVLGCICLHYTDVIMTEGASQLTSLTIVYSAVYSDGDQRKHQSSACGEFTGHRWIPRAKGL